MYDDGGFSGGTLERPAFQRLLSDISAGKIDMVVVYKVDRLTRSLSDFAKIVEVFDKHGVSFVSVTQQFNTTTSMGRLTLNILLSFAQFEREVTGERIRDKIAASKKKGLWMGGQPALGYDIKDRKLVINPIEAETVRSIFRRYLELKSVRLLKADLDAERHRQQAPHGCRRQSLWRQADCARRSLPDAAEQNLPRRDRPQGQGLPGRTRSHRRAGSLGQGPGHPRQPPRRAGRAAEPLESRACSPGSSLTRRANRMSPAHANKKGVRYRYYVSSHLQNGSTEGNRGQGQRIPALSLERLIVRRLCQQLSDVTFVLGCIGSDRSVDAATQKRLVEQTRRLAEAGSDLRSADVRPLTSAMLVRVQVHIDRIELTLNRDRLARWLAGDKAGKARPSAPAPDPDARLTTLSISARVKRAGKEMRLILDDGSDPATPDTSLVRLLVRAHVIRERLINDRSLTLEEIAKSENIVPSYATRLYRLTLLAPDIVGAILAGKHPPELTARRLMDDTRLPLAWHEQRQQLGLDAH